MILDIAPMQTSSLFKWKMMVLIFLLLKNHQKDLSKKHQYIDNHPKEYKDVNEKLSYLKFI